MLTKGAIGNLINRYRAVLAKCNLINTFGSLAVASMLVLGGAGVAGAAEYTPDTIVKSINDGGTHTVNGVFNGQNNNTYGGAFWVTKDSDVTITAGSKFTANEATIGGATGIGTKGKKLTINGTEFIENTATNAGGALGLYKNSEVNDSKFISNSSDLAGAIFVGAESRTYLKDVVFDKNSAIGDGGAIATRSSNNTPNDYVPSNKDATLDVISCIFTENTSGENGGAINNTFYNNSKNTGSVYIYDSNFNINTAQNGGAIYNGKPEDLNGKTGIMTITDSTFTDNIATTAGGAIYNTASADIILSGTNTFSGNMAGGIANDIHNEGKLTINGTATFDGGISGSGSITGSGTIVVNDKAATFEGTLAEGNKLTAKGSARLNDQTGGDINALNMQLTKLGIEATGMDEGFLSGAVAANGTKSANTVIEDTLDMANTAPLAIGRIVMNDVRKRMGDLRDTTEDAGVWMRWDGGKLKGDAGLTNNFNTIQIGGDMLTGIKNVRAGMAAAFTHGDIDHRNGDGEMETYSFSAYGTWMADNGMFADVIARVGFTNTELTVKGNRIDLDNEALSLSGEFGWRFDICQQFYVEPQIELTYTYLTEADTKVSYADYSVDAMDSLIGRAGLAAGWKLPNERGNVYARASVVQEFLGDSELSASALGNTVAHSEDGEDTWLEYGIGANVKLTDSTYVWADVERTEGADIEEEWRGTVGIRYSF